MLGDPVLIVEYLTVELLISRDRIRLDFLQSSGQLIIVFPLDFGRGFPVTFRHLLETSLNLSLPASQLGFHRAALLFQVGEKLILKDLQLRRNIFIRPGFQIGELLIDEGFITPKELEKALQVQQEEGQLKQLPLGKLLVHMGLIVDDDLEEALQHPNIRKNIGSAAVETGLITKEDLETVLVNKKKGQLIGEALIEYGLLTRDDIGRLLLSQLNSSKLGEVLIDLKLITDKDLQEALRKQKSTRALGEICCDLQLITPHDLNYVLEKYGKQVGISDILLKLGYLDDVKLREAKSEQAKTSESLGKILIRKKFLTQEQLQFAFAKKYNLPFLQLKDFSYSQRDKEELTTLISQKYSEKNLILPLSLVNKVLRIAVFKPEQLRITNEIKTLYPHLEISIGESGQTAQQVRK